MTTPVAAARLAKAAAFATELEGKGILSRDRDGLILWLEYHQAPCMIEDTGTCWRFRCWGIITATATSGPHQAVRNWIAAVRRKTGGGHV